MTPEFASVVFGIVVISFFAMDRDGSERSSWTLFIPVIWMSLVGSRTVSEWLGLASQVTSVEQALDGNPLDRNIQAALIGVGLTVLVGRERQVRTLLRENASMVLFFAYCALSIFWSDYPAVAFKRWTKAVGDVVMVLVILTDPAPSAAIKRFLAWIGFLLLPASMLLIKYYPALGQGYGTRDGKARYQGVTLDKNMLGMVCMVVGLGCMWRLSEIFRGREAIRSKGPLVAQGGLLLIVLWVLWKANSMTSLGCFILASAVIATTGAPAVAGRRVVVHFIAAAALGIAFVGLFLEAGVGLVEALGREGTLASRYELWGELLGMQASSLFGAGIESFWLGERLEYLWALHWWRPNEAHNGYLEVLLNLGWIGVGLFTILMVGTYHRILGMFRLDPSGASLRLGYFVAAAAYGLTEAAFRPLTPVWILLLFTTIAIPRTDASTVQGAPA